MLETNNFGLLKPEKTIDNVDIDVINGNMDVVDKGLVLYLGTTSGTANAYTVTSGDIKALAEGVAVCVKFHTAASAASTLNINGWGAKAIKKAGGADVTNLKSSMYTLRYDGTNFILQGEGASGNATASDLLLNKTATTDAGEITGTMPNNGAVNQSLPINGTYNIPAGYHNGSGKVTQSITSKSAATYNPGTSDQTIAAGQYLSGAQTIAAITGSAAAGDVLSGKTFNSAAGIGLTGNMANQGAKVITPGTTNQVIAAGYHNGSGYVVGDPDLIPANILSAANIFGVQGAVQVGKKFASGEATSGNVNITCVFIDGSADQSFPLLTVSGLTFKPSFIIAKCSVSSNDAYMVYLANGLNYNEVAFHVSPTRKTGSSYMLKANASPCYVNSAGFSLPVYGLNRVYYWHAFE